MKTGHEFDLIRLTKIGFCLECKHSKKDENVMAGKFVCCLGNTLEPKEIEFIIDGDNRRYTIFRKNYLDKSRYISLNSFYKILLKLWTIDNYGVYLVQKYCDEKIDSDSLKTGPGPSMFV